MALAALTLTAIGCRDESSTARDLQRQKQLNATATAQIDHLGEATRFISQLFELDRQVASRQILYHLGAWLEQADPQVDWHRPELAPTLPPDASSEAMNELDRRSFALEDIEYLRESYLYSRVAGWATQGDFPDPLLAPWLEQQRQEHTADAARQLEHAIRLFDWTVRNVRLEPLAPSVTAPDSVTLPPSLTYLGPGYRQTSLETLWRGSGDALQRARVFTLLCRQAGIDAAVIAASQEAGQGDGTWFVSAAIDDSLYLFEPQLGIPVPGPDQQGIATLAQAQSDASVLRRLNVPGWFDYPLSSGDLQNCTVLIDAVPQAMSWRMTALEPALTGEGRMQLAVDVDALAERFRRNPGIGSARLWAVPHQARLYQAAIDAALENDPFLARSFGMQFAVLQDRSPLAQARWRHLEGQFENADQLTGALKGYMQVRVPDTEIENLPYDVALQIQHGIRRQPGETSEEFAAKVSAVQSILKGAKQTATYWLALLHFDQAHYDTAAGWFQRRVLEDAVASPWEASSRYALARTLEHLGRAERAVELYKTREIPQEHGNRIRARLLERHDEASPSS